jgi:hypothetical protein
MVLIVPVSIKTAGKRPSIPKVAVVASISTDEDFGWYQDFESHSESLHSLNESAVLYLEVDPPSVNLENAKKSFELLSKLESLPAPPDGPPLDVLESSLSDQRLWYQTAGKRPRQPVQEREYFENLWMKNFESSNAMNTSSSTLNTIVEMRSPRQIITESEDISSVVFRGKGSFSTAVTRSYDEGHMSTVTIQVSMHLKKCLEL